MPHKTIFAWLLIMLFATTVVARYVNETHPNPWRVRYYPKKTLFKKDRLIDKGCKVYIMECPKIYKQNRVCARHYDGAYKTFNNFCEMEYENCNSWRQWSLIKENSC